MHAQLRVHDSLLQICTTYPPSTHIYSVHILCLIQINLKSKTFSKDHGFNFLAHFLVYMKSLPADSHPLKRPRLKVEFRDSVPR